MLNARLAQLAATHHDALVRRITDRASTGIPAYLDAEDLAQDVWLTLAEHPAVVPHPANAWPTLITTADVLMTEATIRPVSAAEVAFDTVLDEAA